MFTSASQEQCDLMVAELLDVAARMGITEEQHRLDSCWKVIFESCFQFDPSKRYVQFEKGLTHLINPPTPTLS